MTITRRMLSIAAGAVAALGLTAATLAVTTANAAVQTGKPAPAFQVADSNGKVHSLADYRGKTVVLEWTNNECPFVVKHYETGNMQALQREAAKDGVVWLSVISSAPGKQGHVAGAKANELTKARNAAPAAVLIDEAGVVGKAFGARTTPHMYVINAKGELVYQGGIDNDNRNPNAVRASLGAGVTPAAYAAEVGKAKNFVRAALADVKAGRAVATPVSTPYGCSVKY
jgi:peroxiredoxin